MPKKKGKPTGRPLPKEMVPHQFKKGQSGNPGGRPKSRILSAAYRSILEKDFPNDAEARTYAELIAEGQAREAIKGKTPAAAEIADRTEGRPLQSVRLDAEVNLTTEDLREKLKAFTKKVRERLAGERKEV